MDGVICFPIAVAAFFILPDLPENTRAFFLNQEVSSVLSDFKHMLKLSRTES